MEVKAKLSFARMTPRKLRLVADLVKGLPVEKAHYQLDFCPKRGAKLVKSVLASAIANAKEKGGVDVDNLYVKSVFVDDGPIMKRFMPRSMGRAYKVTKKMSHLTVVLDEAR
jgi:large subunit ribosomal protein L22